MTSAAAFRVAKLAGFTAIGLLLLAVGGYVLAYFIFIGRYHGDDNPYFSWFLFFACVFIASVLAGVVSAVSAVLGFRSRRSQHDKAA